MNHSKTVGSKAEVFHGTAKHTSGGLHKKDLIKNKAGRIVSRKKMAAGKKAIKRLFAAGYKPTKGKFTAMRKGMRTTRRKGMRGGADALGMAASASKVGATQALTTFMDMAKGMKM
jgi:hypothetical protein|uniref:Uncharacterized protein n=1 Tax=viral metagenome TaxID=1070528 RepID=A0A6C0DGW0_9ZZZZ